MLNDLKHGFRLLPFDWAVFESMMEKGLLQNTDYDLEALEEDYHQTRSDHAYFWRLEIDEIPDEEEFEALESGEEMEIGMRLVVYRIAVSKCTQFSQIILRLLHNLFGHGGEYFVMDMAESLIEDEEKGSVTLFEPFIKGPLKFGYN